MNREELKKKFLPFIKTWDCYNDAQIDEDIVLNNLEQCADIAEAYATKRIQEHEDSKWVKCEERMPENLRNVIVFFDDGIEGYISRGFYSFYEKRWNISSYNTCIYLSVTHWQPLPPSPTVK